MGSPVDDSKLAELSALADGTLEPARRAEVKAQIAASPERHALYERERRAGNTCVLSGVGVPAAELQRLAAWSAPALGHDGS